MENSFASEKKKIWGLCKWTNRKNLTILVAYCAVCLVTLPLAEVLLFLMQNSNGEEGMIVQTRDIINILSVYILPAEVILFSIIMTLANFSYLHNKRSVDLFGALPLSRKGVFVARYLSTIITIIGPMVVTYLLAAVIAFDSEISLEILMCVPIMMIGIIGNISFVAFVSVCVGTVPDAIVSYIILNTMIPFMLWLCQEMINALIVGVNSAELISIFYTMFSPIIAVYVALIDGGLVFYIIWWLLLSAILVYGSLKTVKKRKAETAQLAYAFYTIEVVIKFIVGFTVSIAIGWIMTTISATSYSVKSQYIWYICGFMLANILINIFSNIISRRANINWKRVAKEIIAISVLGMVFLLVIATGLFGVDKYVPNVSDVESVCIKNDWSEEFYIDGQNVLDVEVNDKEKIAEIVSDHQNMVNALEDYKCYGLYPILAIDQRGDYIGDVEFEYHLKDGSIVKRNYEYTYGSSVNWTKYNGERIDKYAVIDKIPEKYIETITVINSKDGYYYLEYGKQLSLKDMENIIKALKSDMKKNETIMEEEYYEDDNSELFELEIMYKDEKFNQYAVTFYGNKEYRNVLETLKNNGVEILGN